MTIIGVTGHTNLTAASLELVHTELLELLRPRAANLVGMTCLARGADQVFADAVLALGGELHVVVPARNYFSGITNIVDRRRCDDYLARTSRTVDLDHEHAGPAAYLAASEYLIDHCELLVAVWDGSPGTGAGGTADAVEYARERERTLLRVWPEGTERA